MQREGLPIPERIQNAPELKFGLELYYGAFFDLCTCRNSAFDIGEISWNAIRDYCRHLGLDEEQTEDMHYLINGMDREYIRVIREKQK